MLDAANPVVRLCGEGIQAEMAGRFDEALRLYRQAWDQRQDDFEACIAAHYLARHQESAADGLRWNQAALDYALACRAEQVQSFLPSLYLNLGWSHESVGAPEQAAECYRRAQAALEALPPGAYRDLVAGGVAAGQERVRRSS